MAAGTRPDWENVGIEFDKEAISAGKKLLQKIRALPLEMQVKTFLPLVPVVTAPLSEAIAEVLKDQEIRNDLLPRFKGTKPPLYIEFIADDGKASGYELSVKDTPPYFDFAVKDREPDGFGLRFLFKDILTFIESVLGEGRLVVPDFLDFYCRGKMQLIMTKGRADWSGFPLFGGLMFYGPHIWATMDRQNARDKVFKGVKALQG